MENGLDMYEVRSGMRAVRFCSLLLVRLDAYTEYVLRM